MRLASILAPFLLVFLLCSPVTAQTGLEGQPAPDFTLKNIEGERVSLAELIADGPVLLDFWATWCVPCKQAIPKFAEVYRKYRDKGFTLVAISTDNTRSVGKVRPYVRSRGWDFPCLLDTDNEVLKRYRGNSVPHAVLVSGEGKIVRVWIGYHPGEEEELEKEVAKLVADTGGEEE